MSQHRYEQLIVKRGQLNHAWEKFIAEGYSFSDLNEEIIWDAIRISIDGNRLTALALKDTTEQVLHKLHVAKNKKLLNAAIVLFGKSFLPDYPQCQLKLARFRGLTRKEFLDNEIVYGNAFELLDRGMFFVQKHLPVAAKVTSEQLQRKETTLLPFTAVREILINAICHRNYNIRGGAIGIAIYDDRLEIFNSGSLPKGITIKQIKQGGISEAPNPLIADVFYKCKLIEKWGRGVSEAIKICKKANIPEPTFNVNDIQVMVTFKFPHSIATSSTEVHKIAASIKLNVRQEEILNILAPNNRLKVTEIQSKIHGDFSAKTLRRDLLIMKKLGLVDTEGHTHKTVWFIKKNN